MDSDEYDLLRRYLLDRLEAGERDGVRQRLLTETPFFELASDVENDLIDAFANGKLSREDAQAVARLVAATGSEQRVDFARALARQTAERAAASQIPVRRSSPFWLAAAAALVFALSSGILLIALHRANSGPSRVSRPTTDPPALIASFDLKPVLRGSNGGQILTVPSNARVVDIRVLAEPGFERYDMALRDGFGNSVWSQTTPDRAPLELLVPAAVLRTGRYELTVDGERGDTSPERIEDTDVEIARE